MAAEGFKRKLTAILSTDVVGYSRLMGEDEAATVKTLETYKRVISDLILQHRGRVVDSPGDNLLAEFASVVDAVHCGVAVQKEIETHNLELPETRRMQFRIGINLGDVIEEADRLYGDGVNIAARLESLAEPGGICISKTAFDHIETKLPLGYVYLGKQSVKNITKRVGVYKVLMEPRVKARRRFRYFALISILLVAVGVAVFWRFDFPLVGPKFDKASEIFWQFALSLVGKAEKAPGEQTAYPLPDTARVPAPASKAETLVPAPPAAPAKPAVPETTAEDYFNKGQEAKEPQEKIEFYNQAIKLNPQYAQAYNYRGLAYFEKKFYEIALSDYNKAIILEPNNANPYNNLGNYYATVKKDYDRALREYDKAIALSPNDARVYSNRGFAYDRNKDPENAMKDYNKALELDPELANAYINRGGLYLDKKQLVQALQDFDKAIELDPLNASGYYSRGSLYYQKREYAKALQDFNRAIELNPNYSLAYAGRGAVYITKKEGAKALKDYDKAVELNPDNHDIRVMRENLKKQLHWNTTAK